MKFRALEPSSAVASFSGILRELRQEIMRLAHLGRGSCQIAEKGQDS